MSCRFKLSRVLQKAAPQRTLLKTYCFFTFWPLELSRNEKSLSLSFHSDAFCEVSWLVDLAAAQVCDVVREKL